MKIFLIFIAIFVVVLSLASVVLFAQLETATIGIDHTVNLVDGAGIKGK